MPGEPPSRTGLIKDVDAKPMLTQLSLLPLMHPGQLTWDELILIILCILALIGMAGLGQRPNERQIDRQNPPSNSDR